MSDHIRTALADGVLTVTLDRADKKNAITQAMYAALAEATERARTDDAVRVLLLRGEGDSFSAGNDIQDFISLGSQSAGPGGAGLGDDGRIVEQVEQERLDRGLIVRSAQIEQDHGDPTTLQPPSVTRFDRRLRPGAAH